jgi:hypothetical protein
MESPDVLIDRSKHVPWIVACLVVLALFCVWYFAANMGRPTWMSGGEGPGFVLGIVGGALCLFEFLLWPRKAWFRTWRLGRMTTWMRAHIWLGLLSVPLLWLHSGFRWGGTLSTVLMALFLIVIASGIWGLVVQQFLPSQMLNELPAETIYSQIPYISAQLTAEARRLVVATCGPAPNGQADPEDLAAASEVGVGHMVVGAVRTAGRTQGKVLQTVAAPAAPVPDSEALRVFFKNTLKPYLLGEAPDSPLSHARGAEGTFQDLRTRVPPAAHGVVEVLEGMCEQRRQMDQQARLQFWLHNWLWVHLPLSVALILLMFVHVFVSLMHW